MASALAKEHKHRVVIEHVQPEIDCGQFPIKRTVGETVLVEASAFADGHDEIRCLLLHGKQGESSWNVVSMRHLGNDRWQGQFPVTELGIYRYSVQAMPDHFATWRSDLRKRLQAGQDVALELVIGARLLRDIAQQASAADADQLRQWANRLEEKSDVNARIQLALDEDLAQRAAQYPDQRFASTYAKQLLVIVDRERARFSSWYEFFPRSTANEPGKHGTFRDAEKHLEYVAAMGFDVVYLPPIHPIGQTFRKGKNNAVSASPDDPGSPWGIGAAEGGHKAIHPAMGTLADFQRFQQRARELGMEIALDIAIQCSPDHPYAREHRAWFRERPDGTIQYAENPPKKYQDIYPIDFDSERWTELWEELRSVFFWWIEQGVKIFRVDNPHTKPFSFWQWLITEVRRHHPDVLFLAEAFTRPKVMYRLAKLGFTQSYTYFTWRNSKWELTEYFTELTQTEVREFFRPNLWPNTPDILHAFLQHGGRPAFIIRLILAATLGASYGMYGPAFELCVHQPREPGSEEYRDSEKYEIKQWDLSHPDSLRDIIARVNRIRRENPALHSDRTLQFHPVSNDQLICYSKRTDDCKNIILVAVNLDPHNTHSGWVELPLDQLLLDPAESYQVHDLLGNTTYLWHGRHNYVELNPHVVPAHVFRIRRRVPSQGDF